MDIKSFFKNKTILITLAGVVVVVVIIAAIYLPGTLFRGAFIPESSTTTRMLTDTEAISTEVVVPELTCEAVSLSSDGKFYVGEEMKWNAIITPEPTSTWTYTWSGTDLTETSGQEIAATYSSIGLKRVNLSATFTPDSALMGGITKTTMCTVLIEEAEGEAPPEEPALTCEPVSLSSDGNFYVGEEMKWKATITPEPTTATTYTWNGAELTETTGQEISVPNYSSAGTKKVTLAAIISSDAAGIVAGPAQQELKTMCTVLVEESTSTVKVLGDAPLDTSKLLDTRPEATIVKAICQGNPSGPETDETVAWTALTKGLEDKQRVIYTWGADAADASGTGKTVYSKYSDEGLKAASLRITYLDGEPINTRCSVNVKDSAAPVTQLERIAPPIAALAKSEPCTALTDIEGHWSQSYVEHGVELGLFKGFDDCTFRPDDPISRRDSTYMVIYAKRIPPYEGCDSENCGTPFKDISAPENSIIRAAYDNGIVKGYGDLFLPNRTIPRSDAMALVVKAFFEPFEGCYTAHCGAGWPDNFFDDLHDDQGIYARVLWDFRIVEGSPEVKNRLFPDDSITRAEMAKMIVLAYEEAN